MKISNDQLEVGKNMYMEGKTFQQISDQTGMSMSNVKYYVATYWKPEREKINTEIMEVMASEKAADLVEITAYGLSFLKQSLKKLVEKASVEPSPGLLKTISTIVFEINKIKALDEGKPTEILSELRPASIVEMRELLKNDPFMQIEDADILPLEEKSND